MTRPAGRPQGACTRLWRDEGPGARRLGRQEMALARALADGLGLERAWRAYPVADHTAAQGLRHLRSAVEQAVRRQGLQAEAAPLLRLLRCRALARPQMPDAQVPSLEAWIEAYCAEQAVDPDFHAQREWIAMYQAALRSPAPAHGPALSALVHARAADAADRVDPAERRAVLRLLDRLEQAGPALPSPDDALERWLAGRLPATLQAQGIRTLGDLAGHLAREGASWHRRVPGLGAVRARRLADGLSVLASAWIAPPAVPAPFPALPPTPFVQARLAGRTGRTRQEYARSLERLWWWCRAERGCAPGELKADDLHAYGEFLRAPPPAWTESQRVARSDPRWRPFRGPLSAASVRRELRVLGCLLREPPAVLP